LFDRSESATRRQSRDTDGKPRGDCARGNRLNLDTGAVYGGPLTAAVFDDAQMEPIGFLQAE
jgi:hypothetical protein